MAPPLTALALSLSRSFRLRLSASSISPMGLNSSKSSSKASLPLASFAMPGLLKAPPSFVTAACMWTLPLNRLPLPVDHQDMRCLSLERGHPATTDFSQHLVRPLDGSKGMPWLMCHVLAGTTFFSSFFPNASIHFLPNCKTSISTEYTNVREEPDTAVASMPH